MNKLLAVIICSTTMIAGTAFAASEKAELQMAMMSPAISNPVSGKLLREPTRICNDSKMACIPGVDKCCSGKACPSSGVCP